jgi:sorting nexin-1/2
MGDTVNKITYKMEETDPWFEDKVVQLEALETQLKKLYILTEAVASNRRDLAIATGSFAQITALLATTEEAHNLSRAMGHLAKVEEKVEFAHHKQADADFVHLFELIKDYVNLMGAVKDALTERQKAFQVSIECFRQLS